MDIVKSFFKNLKKYLLLIIPLLVIIAVFLVFFLNRGPGVKAQEIQEGVDFITSLEAKDVNSIKPKISEYRREERRRLLLEGEISIWDTFEDYAILGDSRAVGFYYHEFLDESRCFAFGGATIRNIADYIEDLKSLNPKYIYLCFGLNDVGIGFWSTPEEYAEEYKEIIMNLRSELPNATIVVSSILIARDPAFEDNSAWYEIPDFNYVLMQMCAENDIKYADNTNICDEYPDLWDIDGIHLKDSFYPYWAANLLAEAEDES